MKQQNNFTFLSFSRKNNNFIRFKTQIIRIRQFKQSKQKHNVALHYL